MESQRDDLLFLEGANFSSQTECCIIHEMPPSPPIPVAPCTCSLTHGTDWRCLKGEVRTHFAPPAFLEHSRGVLEMKLSLQRYKKTLSPG